MQNSKTTQFFENPIKATVVTAIEGTISTVKVSARASLFLGQQVGNVLVPGQHLGDRVFGKSDRIDHMDEMQTKLTEFEINVVDYNDPFWYERFRKEPILQEKMFLGACGILPPAGQMVIPETKISVKIANCVCREEGIGPLQFCVDLKFQITESWRFVYHIGPEKFVRLATGLIEAWIREIIITKTYVECYYRFFRAYSKPLLKREEQKGYEILKFPSLWNLSDLVEYTAQDDNEALQDYLWGYNKHVLNCWK